MQHMKIMHIHLAAFRGRQLIELNDNRYMKNSELPVNIFNSDFVLVLISPNFLARIEMMDILDKVLMNSTVQVIPIIIESIGLSEWISTPLGGLQSLPRDGRPVSIRSDRDAVWVDISSSLLQLFDEYSRQSRHKVQMTPASDRGSRKDIFISYNHVNKKWLKDVHNHLSSLRQGGVIDHWDDTRIQPGSIWEEEIKQALKRARFAVLLVSSEFLASDFIIKNELPPILEAAKEEGLVVMQLIVNPCRLPKTLSRFQTVNPPSKTLIEMKAAERARIFVKLAEEIEAAVAASQ